MAYAAKDITVLKGLEPVRERPGMYIGSTGPTGLHHLVYEVVDNSVDEAMAGYATRIDVTLLADGGCRVVDNGRGIPVDPHPEYQDKSAAEVVLTMLHAGGKFGGEGYKISGGLHGVGVSVVNALSSRLDLEIHRDGGKWEQRFAKGGKPAGQARARSATSEDARHDDHVLARRDDLRGDRVPRPDAASSGCARWRSSTRASRSVFRDERADEPVEQIFKFNGGIVDFVDAPQRVEGAAVQAGRRRIADTDDDAEVEIAMQWNTGYYEGIHSFANNIATTEGGMHEEGFKKALTNVVNRYAPRQGPPQGEGRQPPRRGHPRGPHRDHLGEAAQPAVRGPDQDQARQHRDALAGREGHQREARRLARGAPDRGARQVVAKATQAAHGPDRRAPGARPHAAQVAARVVGDAGQARRLLVDATPPSAELFIVEGDSAGGSAKQARNPDVPGDPADPRQDPQRRARAPRQDAARTRRSRR